MDDYKSRTKVFLHFPTWLIKEFDEASRLEHRTRSEALREAARLYIDYCRVKNESNSRSQVSSAKIEADSMQNSLTNGVKTRTTPGKAH